MATVRDPAFWKRFSTAARLHDVESGSTIGAKERINTDNSWLARQEQKKKKRALICWTFWGVVFAICGVVAVVVVILANQGLFTKLGEKLGASGMSAA